MKRIFLSLAILLAAQIGFAQEEVAIEQNINQRINKLEINSGWDVHLIHHEADSGYRVAIITEDDLAARAYNVQLCNVKDQTLTILENTQLPRGTVVEIEGPMTFGQINLLNNATEGLDQPRPFQVLKLSCPALSHPRPRQLAWYGDLGPCPIDYRYHFGRRQCHDECL